MFSVVEIEKTIIKTHSWKNELIPKYGDFPYAFKMGLTLSSPQYISDTDFDARCPEKIRGLSQRHWTPVAIARTVAKYLATSHKTKILDIGSGVGKFCVVGAAYTNAYFTGVEQRKNLCNLAEKIAHQYNLPNAQFIHNNITQIDFTEYDALYFYNSFHENMEQTAAIDFDLELNPTLYHQYNQYLVKQLAKMPKGTKLVTYWADREVPLSYELLYTDLFGALKFWRKSK